MSPSEIKSKEDPSSNPADVVVEGSKEEEVVDPSQFSSIRYTREELLILEKTDLSILRPDYLAIAYDRYYKEIHLSH